MHSYPTKLTTRREYTLWRLLYRIKECICAIKVVKLYRFVQLPPIQSFVNHRIECMCIRYYLSREFGGGEGVYANHLVEFTINLLSKR